MEDRKFDGMPMYWRWLENANYEGLDEVHEVNYDLWAVNVRGHYVQNVLKYFCFLFVEGGCGQLSNKST